MLDTDEYRNAPGDGNKTQLGRMWQDKPHRLVYDLCHEIDRLRRRLDAAIGEGWDDARPKMQGDRGPVG